MCLIRSFVVIICTLFVFAAPASAAEVNFDDLAEVFDEPLVSPYEGFTWENFRYFTADFDGDTILDGFDRGVVSPENAAYSGGANNDTGVQIVGTISRATPFDFISAYFGSPNFDTMNLTVQGFLGATLLYSQVVGINNDGADLFTFNFTGIDTVKIFGSFTSGDPLCDVQNCSQFTLDTFTYGPATAPIPEPTTLALVGAGALVGLRRLRRRR